MNWSLGADSTIKSICNIRVFAHVTVISKSMELKLTVAIKDSVDLSSSDYHP